MMMLISLIGYRGTGKSTVGQLLAERLGWRCVDTDAEVQALAGKSIRQIFADDGEQGFRTLETRVIADLTRQHKIILALGGGAVLQDKNRRAIGVAGPVVWLTALPETIHARIADDPVSSTQRPNLTQFGGLDEIQRVLNERLPIYQSCADCTIPTDHQAPRDVVDFILRTLDLLPQHP